MKILFRILLAVAVVVTATAYAGETGSVSGVVKDGTGAPIPGATVKATGAQAPRSLVSGESGRFAFPKLLPGSYVVTAELTGLGTASQKVQVLVDSDAQLTLVLVQTAKAEIVVTGAMAEIDKKSAEVNFNYTDNVVKDLPLARTYDGLLNIVPGAAADTSGQGFIAASGGTRQDNKYLLDGINITNPGYGYLGIDTNQLDIADFNVKKAGISAEFGRTSGAMFNAVTRSGTNEVNGALQLNFSPDAFQAGKKSDTGQTKDTSLYNGSANIGFPILKDTLFGYASARYASSTASNQSATINNVTTTQPDTTLHNGDYFGKLTAFVGQPLLFNLGFRALPNSAKNSFNSIYDADTAGYKYDTTNYLGNVTGNWFATKDTVVEAKYVYLYENDTSNGQNIVTGQPLKIDPNNLGAYGAMTNPARKDGNVGVAEFAETGDKFSRNEVKLTVSQYLDLGPTQNQFKIGGGYEDDTMDTYRVTNGWGTFGSMGARYTCSAPYCGPTSVPGLIRARYYILQPVQYSRARTYSAFIQDTVTWKNLTVYLGLLANRDDFAQVCKPGAVGCPTQDPSQSTRYNFMTFHWDQQLQPRLGITWNTNLIKGDKLYSTYGEYASMDQKSTSRSFAPYRIRQDQAFFDPVTGAWLGQQIRGSSTGKLIPPDLKPPYYQEWVIGYSAAATRDISFDVYYQYRNLKNVFEDAPINPDNYGGNFLAEQVPWARRVYRAVTLDVQKRYANGWYADANITFSKLYGNLDADYNTAIFNTSSYMEDGPGWNSAEEFRYGRLGEDRPVIFKLMGSYDFRFGLTMGGFLRVQSGTPWQARGKEPVSTLGQSRYIEPAASQRLPTWTNFDLLAAYTFNFAGGLGLRLEARLQNVFDTQTVLAVDQLKYLDQYVDGTPARNLGPQGTTQPNPLYGTGTGYASPRRLILTAQFNF